MAGLITVADLREQFDISPQVTDGRLTRMLVAAKRRLRGWVGEAAYADALAAAPDDTERQESLELAEAHLAMHFAIVGLNSPLRREGIVAEEKVEGGTVLRYLNPDQTAALARQYLEIAEEIARPYLVDDGTPAGPIALED